MTTAAPLQPTLAHLPQPPTIESKEAAPFAIPRGPVIAKLSFFSPPEDGSAPFNYVERPPEGVPQRNFGATDEDVTIQDMRGQEQTITLDTHSFQAIPSVPSRTNPTSDYTIRRTNPDAPRAPVTRVHVDQTTQSALQRVDLHVPDAEEAARLKQGRVRIVNVWRPLNAGPVVSFPLAVADGSSVADDQLVGVEHRYPNRKGETAAVKHHPAQSWWYWSGMTADERLLLKCFDSHEVHGAVGRAPHTAFVDPRTPEGAPGRESIEVRTLVFG